MNTKMDSYDTYKAKTHGLHKTQTQHATQHGAIRQLPLDSANAALLVCQLLPALSRGCPMHASMCGNLDVPQLLNLNQLVAQLHMALLPAPNCLRHTPALLPVNVLSTVRRGAAVLQLACNRTAHYRS